MVEAEVSTVSSSLKLLSVGAYAADASHAAECDVEGCDVGGEGLWTTQ